MIDIHSHILPGVDDGADNIKESLAIAKTAVADGLTGIVATPHFMEEGYRMSPAEIEQRVEDLQREMDENGINLMIYPGAELFIYQDLAKDLAEGLVPTINGGKYILIEFPMSKFPSYTEDVLYDIQVMGYRPVICHPERYSPVMEDPNKIVEWINSGIYAQVNASSLIGVFGEKVKKTAEILLKHNMVQLIGSDVHTLNKRKQCLREGMDKIRQLTGDNVEIFIENNERIVNNRELKVLQPLIYEEKKGIINKMLKYILP